jgi:hypothetical protein
MMDQHVFRIADGKIKELRRYFDPKPLKDVGEATRSRRA